MFDDIGRNFLMNPQNGLKVVKIIIILLSLLLHHQHSAHILLLIYSVHLHGVLDSTLHEGPPQQGEGQGAI